MTVKASLPSDKANPIVDAGTRKNGMRDIGKPMGSVPHDLYRDVMEDIVCR